MHRSTLVKTVLALLAAAGIVVGAAGPAFAQNNSNWQANICGNVANGSGNANGNGGTASNNSSANGGDVNGNVVIGNGNGNGGTASNNSSANGGDVNGNVGNAICTNDNDQD